MSPFRKFKALQPLERTVLKLGAMCGMSLVVVLTLVIAVLALSLANSTSDGLHGGCGFLRGVASAPVTPQTSALGLTLQQQARFWYQAAHCAGDLPVPNPIISGH